MVLVPAGIVRRLPAPQRFSACAPIRFRRIGRCANTGLRPDSRPLTPVPCALSECSEATEVLSLNDIHLQIAGETLLDRASVRLHDGWRVGVIGRNGCGKSSLFKLILGEIAPDRGEIELPGGARIAHMAQETAGRDTTAVDHVLGGHAELSRVQQQLERAEANGDVDRIVHLHGELDRLDGYTARSRAEVLLSGLGFGAHQFDWPMAQFSGGWRVRLDLARALMRPSDVLLLDEPTNHLDLDAVIWLEQWLTQFPGMLLLISHDRDFLDNVIEHVAHIDHRQLFYYRGNYSGFERQRAERLAQQQAAYEKQQQRVREIEQFVARFRAKATKARQAQSRLKELERMEQIAPAHVDSPFRFRFPDAERVSNPLATLRELSVGYDRSVLENVDFSILPGDRIGLLGPNGAGKSTLIRTLVGELAPLAGECLRGEHLRIGYFAQHQLDALALGASALDHLRRESPGQRDQVLRDFIGGFGFSGDDALVPVKRFSGGEKARLALALVAWRRPNLLLLDEPTNHLDLEMRYALDLALQSFSGAVVLVTHDRHLLRDTVDTFRLVADGRAAEFNGDLDDYRDWLRERRGRASQPVAAASAARPAPPDRKEARREAARRRAALQPLRREVERLERELDRQRAALTELDEALADPTLYEDERRPELRALLQQQGDLRQRLEDTETAWLEASERLENADSANA